MREYLRSFRLFWGRNTQSNITFAALFVAEEIMLAAFIFMGDTADVFPLFGISEILNSVLHVIFLYMCARSPQGNYAAGCKYFPAVPDIGRHFSRAVVFVNILSAGITAALAAINAALCAAAGKDGTPLWHCAAIAIALVGVINFTGSLKSTKAFIVILTVLLCVSGFSFGFFAGLRDAAREAGEAPSSLTILAASAAAVVFRIISVIFSAKKSEGRWKKWAED